jgi:hypothetical protein
MLSSSTSAASSSAFQPTEFVSAAPKDLTDAWADIHKPTSDQDLPLWADGSVAEQDTWLRCNWCLKWGKCPCFVILDRDIDGTGTLCDPCYYRGCPPHYEYLGKLLAARLTAAPEVLEAIAAFAYPICNGVHFATCRCPACR